MAWFKRRTKEANSDALEALADDVYHDLNETNRAEPNRPRFWIDHGFENGDQVECAVCGAVLVVELLKYSPITVSTDEAHANRPLICGSCGRLFCLTCSIRRHPNLPSCDRCQQVGGVTGLMK